MSATTRGVKKMIISTILIIAAATIINGLLLIWHIKYWKMQFILDSQHRQATYCTDRLYEQRGEKYDMMLSKYHEYIDELKSRDMVDQEKEPWKEKDWKWERGD